jgi:hypothetical protein
MIRSSVRERLKGLFDSYSHLLGREILDAEKMVLRHPRFCQPCAPGFEARVPDAFSIDGRIAPELGDGPRHYCATYIYRFPQGAFRRLELLASGGLLIDKRMIPNTGVGNQRATLVASIQPKLRKSRRESCIVAPWPHYMPITYGDFMLHILPRICRIVNRLTDEEKSRAVIAYPLAKTAWEKDYLGKLGFEPGRMVDTRVHKVECSSDGVLYAASGEDSGWFSRSAHPGDYEDARKALWKCPAPGSVPSRRLYLQRKGRRRILNEQELLAALQPHGFETVELGEHSITDQMAMIAGASVILGPQGANMNSMLWSPKGAAVVELFNRGFRPAYNRQMAYNLSLDYYYLAQQPMERHDFSHLNWDIEANIDAVKKFLARTVF